MSVLEEVRHDGHGHPPGFRHEAMFYADEDEFVASTVPFIREGVDAGEEVLVAVVPIKARRLTEELEGGLDGVTFVDMPSIGVNPARIIPVWRQFVDAKVAEGRRFRGIGEPAWPGRSGAEFDECARHESLLNLAFDGGAPWRLLCPYDSSLLPDDVLATARRTHPVLVEHGSERPSDAYDPQLAVRALEGELPAPGSPAGEIAFDAGGLRRVREFVGERGRSLGLEPDRAGDLKVAVNELATNSVRHGGGGGSVQLWIEGGELICEVRDRGRIRDPLTGRHPPSVEQLSGRGVWLANHLCDLVRVRSTDVGAVIRLHMALP